MKKDLKSRAIDNNNFTAQMFNILSGYNSVFNYIKTHSYNLFISENIDTMSCYRDKFLSLSNYKKEYEYNKKTLESYMQYNGKSLKYRSRVNTFNLFDISKYNMYRE
jgi:hypothetical protein